MSHQQTIDTDIFELLRNRNIPFALFRLPFGQEVRLMIQYKSNPLKINDLKDLPSKSGFLLAPFPVNGGEPILLLQPDLVCSPNEAMGLAGNILKDCSLFLNDTFPANSNVTTSQEEFKAQVQNAVNVISEGDLYKVVLSKNKVIDKPDGFRPEFFFDKLCHAYPHAMVYYWQLPGVGSWMGATPEPLMKEQDGMINTVSLAGTQLYHGQPLEDVCWRAKEIAEQAIVSRFIVQLLDKMGVEEMGITGPHNFLAGNLVHLNTGFTFHADNLRVSRGRFVSALHPTPSVAGLPREESLQLIRRLEQYNRSYFSGLLGPLQLGSETHLYVNLRCMQLFDRELVLYSGAGITENSDPEREWNETENKMKTLLNIFDVQTGN
jgi:isochorismate synthase